jgi:hypothetical protein
MEVRFKNVVTISGSYTQQGLSNHITFRPIKSGATVPLIKSFFPFLGFVYPDTCWNMENQLTALRKYSLLACNLTLHTDHPVFM